MATKLQNLPEAMKQLTVYVIMRDEKSPAVIDGECNSTGEDMALFFSTIQKARAYKAQYPSLRNLDVYEATIAEIIEIFGGKVQNYILDYERE
jgi:hypothetical protein